MGFQSTSWALKQQKRHQLSKSVQYMLNQLNPRKYLKAIVQLAYWKLVVQPSQDQSTIEIYQRWTPYWPIKPLTLGTSRDMLQPQTKQSFIVLCFQEFVSHSGKDEKHITSHIKEPLIRESHFSLFRPVCVAWVWHCIRRCQTCKVPAADQWRPTAHKIVRLFFRRNTGSFTFFCEMQPSHHAGLRRNETSTELVQAEWMKIIKRDFGGGSQEIGDQ